MSVREGSSLVTSPTLLARVRRNEEEAWERLVSLYAPLVHHHCRRAHLSLDDAADVFQEVFRAAFTRIETFEKRRPSDTFRGWISTIARNKVNDHFRRRVRHPPGVGGTEIQRALASVPGAEPVADTESASAPASSDEPLAGTELDAERGVVAAALERIRGSFHENTWRAFLGTAVQGRAPKDVGDELGMRAGAVRVAKSRVLQRLRAELGDV